MLVFYLVLTHHHFFLFSIAYFKLSAVLMKFLLTILFLFIKMQTNLFCAFIYSSFMKSLMSFLPCHKNIPTNESLGFAPVITKTFVTLKFEVERYLSISS